MKNEIHTVHLATAEEIAADTLARRAAKQAEIMQPSPKCPCGQPAPMVKPSEPPNP